MARSRGSWLLDKAIVSQWTTKQLEREFRREWAIQTETRYQALHDEVARPVPPGPYCVYRKAPPRYIGWMTGTEAYPDSDYATVSFDFELRIHAKNTATESGKAIAKRLAKKVTAAFDPDNALPLDNSLYVVTIRGADWSEREGDQEWVWILQYSILVDTKTDKAAWVIDAADIIDNEDIEDDDMLDFADLNATIGGQTVYGTYNSTSAATNNTTILNAYLATSEDKWVRFGGPRNTQYNNKRTPGTVYFNGTITLSSIASSLSTPRLILDGAGSKLIGSGMASATTPLLSIGVGGNSRHVVIRDMTIQSDGSGILLTDVGVLTHLSDLRITATGSGTIDDDDWTDLNSASYGLKMTGDCDGGHFDNVSCISCTNHGFLIAERWHDGIGYNLRSHGCGGSGFKGQRIQKCSLTMRHETNTYWGMHIRRSGIGYYDGSSLVGVTSNTPSSWEVWLENNNKRGSDALPVSSGHAVRQAKIEDSGALVIAGHSGWGSNKINIDWGSRNNCILIEGLQIDQSIEAAYDLVNDATPDYVLPHNTASSSIHNWTTVWEDIAYRPSVAVAGAVGTDQRFVITIPAGCFDSADGSASAYWRPWGLQSMTTANGDKYIYEAEISVNANGYNWCIGREETSAKRQQSTLCMFQIDPVSAAKTWCGVYDGQRRKFRGVVTVGSQPVVTPTPSLISWFDGMNNESNYPQSNAITLTIHSWKFYRLPNQ